MNIRSIPMFILKSNRYKFLKNNFLHLRFQRVHQPHPAHRGTGFQFLGDACRLHHAGQHGVHTLPRRPVNLQQVRIQLFTQNQAAVKAGAVFFQVALPHTVILSYVPSRHVRLGFFFEAVNRPVLRTRKFHSTQWGSCSGAQSPQNCLRWCRRGHSRPSPQCLHGRIARPGRHHPSRKR